MLFFRLGPGGGDIMVLVISLVATALTTALLMLLTKNGGSDFGPQVQDQNKSISSLFHYYANKVGMKNESEMLHFQVPTQLPVATQVRDKQVVELPVATEVQDKDLVLEDMKEILKMLTGHEEGQDKHLVFQDIRDILKIATGHEEDVG